MELEDLMRIFPRRLRMRKGDFFEEIDKMQELRFRIGQPVELIGGTRRIWQDAIVTRSDIREMLEYISGYSLYAFDEEIAQGFITIPGGHRVGVAGQVVMADGKIKTMRNISFLNIRLSHEIIGCGENVIPYILDDRRMLNTLIVSPPRCGKTTLLRDLVRIVSGKPENKSGKSVVVVDERSEIAGCYRGMPQNDLGCRTDVLDGCPKSHGMMMAVRSLSPEVLVVDEIGGEKDIRALRYAMNCGSSLLATIHGGDFKEVREKPLVKELVEEQLFRRYIILKGGRIPGQIQEILDERGMKMWC
nr:stage III sporulation protein AA [Eubacterium sp.]